MANQAVADVFPTLPFSWAAATDIGKVRDENQDSFTVEPEAGIFLVADGMGGHRGGAIAANIVAEDLPVMIETGLARLKSRRVRSIRNLLKKSITEQNRQVKMEGHSESGRKGMGTTLAVALLHDRRAYIANLGDSRAYRLRKGRLKQLTKDHSVVEELIDKGKLSPEDAQGHEAADQITHYVGMEEKAAPHIRSFALQKGDRFMLCTDGLTAMVPDTDIADILKSAADPQHACDALVAAANAAGGEDNITALVVDYPAP
jgi:protein phosphatase